MEIDWQRMTPMVTTYGERDAECYQGSQLKSFFHVANQFIQDTGNGNLYHSKQETGPSPADNDGGPTLKNACTHLFPLVLVEDGRCEVEHGVAEKPQKAALHGTQ